MGIIETAIYLKKSPNNWTLNKCELAIFVIYKFSLEYYDSYYVKALLGSQ